MADKSSQRRNVMSGNTNIDFVYGLPPASHMTEEIIANTMPIAEITPAEPKFSEV